MTSKMLKAMMEAQKKARMKPNLRTATMSAEKKVVYVPPARATISKSTQEAHCAQTLESQND
jgi:hypothetical protein